MNELLSSIAARGADLDEIDDWFRADTSGQPAESAPAPDQDSRPLTAEAGTGTRSSLHRPSPLLSAWEGQPSIGIDERSGAGGLRDATRVRDDASSQDATPIEGSWHWSCRYGLGRGACAVGRVVCGDVAVHRLGDRAADRARLADVPAGDAVGRCVGARSGGAGRGVLRVAVAVPRLHCRRRGAGGAGGRRRGPVPGGHGSGGDGLATRGDRADDPARRRGRAMAAASADAGAGVDRLERRRAAAQRTL